MLKSFVFLLFRRTPHGSDYESTLENLNTPLSLEYGSGGWRGEKEEARMEWRMEGIGDEWGGDGGQGGGTLTPA